MSRATDAAIAAAYAAYVAARDAADAIHAAAYVAADEAYIAAYTDALAGNATVSP